jgi:hypothetical protein
MMRRGTLRRRSTRPRRTSLAVVLYSRGPIESNPPRDDLYKAWIREQPCLACDVGPSEYHPIEAAHTGPHAYGRKASDYSCLPLCVSDHRTGSKSYHNLGEARWLELHKIDLRAELLALHDLYRRRYPNRDRPSLPQHLMS